VPIRWRKMIMAISWLGRMAPAFFVCTTDC
jgi:hypothetical protein